MRKKVEEKKPWSTKIKFLDRMSHKDKTALFKHLSTMITAGIPLEKALLAIHKQTKSKSFHRILHKILLDINAGETLSSSMKTMPHIFDALVINLVSIGEKTGTLAGTLLQIYDNYKKAGKLRGKILGTMLYPIIVVFGTFGTVIYLVFVLLPQITPLFVTMNVELPWSTRFLMSSSAFIQDNGVWIGIGMILVIIIYFLLLRLQKFRYFVHRFILMIPVLNTLVKKTQIAQIAQMLNVLLSAGVSIVESFNIAANSLNNLVYKNALRDIAASIQEGENISEYLDQNPHLFSAMMTQVVSVGEEVGNLPEGFNSIAEFTEEEIDDAIKILTTLLEPALMIFIGGVVGFVALAVITPIYELTSSIGG